MRSLAVIALLLLLPHLSDAQRWKRFRKEYTFSIGASNFLGDLGGADQIGTNGLKDLEFSMTQPALALGYRYQVTRDIKVRANLLYLRLKGDDQTTNEIYRRNRNLSFRSPLVELSVRGEYYFFTPRQGHIYRLRGVRGKSGFQMNVYAWGGVGGIWFNPKAQYNGQWYALQPLGTEGQGHGGGKKYSRISFVIPFGMGVRRNFDKQWSLSLELGMRKTFTDYIDDVSGDYYNNQKIAQNDPVAAYFADPSDDNPKRDGWTAAGEQRGDPTDKDSYMTAVFTVGYKILKRRRHLPKF